MQYTIAQLASLVNGKIDQPEKAGNVLNTFSKIEEGKEGSLCFLANKQYEKYLYDCEATAVLVAEDFETKSTIKPVLIKVADPYAAFAILLQKYEDFLKQNKAGIHPTAVIAENAKIGKDVFIGPFVIIEENCLIADNCQLFAHAFIGRNCSIGKETVVNSGVKIYHDSIIGGNCIIHSGTIIGSDGFGFAPTADGSYEKIPQIGNVILEDNVEIGANCCVDRATLGSTVLRKGVKLDNLIQVAHNVEIGENTVIAAQTGISGSVFIGKNCMIGGQVGIAGHISIADGSKVNAQSGISKSIKEPNKSWSGTPAREFRQHYKGLAYLGRIPDLIDRVKEIEKRIE